jgi:hypothetical protein
MARLTLARKIATIVLIVWKKGVCFDAQHVKPQTALQKLRFGALCQAAAGASTTRNPSLAALHLRCLIRSLRCCAS